MQHSISIVLTGTIVPNSVFTAHADAQVRKNEYLQAIHFYTKFGQVYFLENSTYPVESDPEFTSIDNLKIRKMPVSLYYDKGKGYQEFEMLDRWLAEEKDPPLKWFKISGRYIFKNFDMIIQDCLNDERYNLVIDQMSFQRIAFTDLFFITTDDYLRCFKGIYTLCEDTSGKFIERVVFAKLSKEINKSFRLFTSVPKISAIGGSFGDLKDDSDTTYYWKSVLRSINIRLNSRYLLHPSEKTR